jgi:AcrR family transcriptional regulator
MVDGAAPPFAQPRPGSSADRLVGLTLDYMLADGAPTDSLRAIAEAIGTSHRMLQYHFHTKERLLGCVLLKFQERMTVTEMPEFTSRSEYVRFSWEIYREPDSFLMMEILILITNPAAGAVNDESLMKRLSNRWSETLVELGLREGLPPARAEAEARLVRDAWRGMHQDIYSTGDRVSVDAAFEVLLHWLDASPSLQPSDD